MKKNLQYIEPLEARIAPAVLVNGGNLLGGNGNPSTGETSTGGNTVTLIKVLHGQALVFFNASTAKITGISIGAHTKLDITGNVFGDIVTNLLPNGRLTDSDGDPSNGEDGGVLLGTNVKGITTHLLETQFGDIGRIIAGGSIKNINVNGQLNGLYAGDGIFRDGDTATVKTGGVDYNSILPNAQTQFLLTQSAAQPHSSAGINKVAVNTANQMEIFAGNGQTDGNSGVGLGGGGISNVTITKTLTGQGTKPALSLHAGDGGAGSTGGAGGSITNFDDMGSIAYVRVQTGDGGVGKDGHGGSGGSLSASTITTSSPRYDLLMGRGGDGTTAGGAGGSISALNFQNDVNGGKSFITQGDFNGDGVQDVLLVNTLTGEATLSLGAVNADGTTSFSVAVQPNGNAGVTPFIAAQGAVPNSVATADLNADGHLDFVVSYAATNNLGVFLGHGDGTFTASAVTLTASPTKVVAADFVGTTALDLAVLSSGDVTSNGGTSSSQIFLVQNDGTAHFTALTNPTTIAGVGTDLATAQIDKAGGNDLFVGLASGYIDTLFANGAAFVQGTTINAFNPPGNLPGAPVTSIDVGPASSTTSTLLAFSANINVNNKDLATVIAPQVDVFQVGPSGAVLGESTFQPVASAVATAHFVQGTDVVGVVGTQALTLYSQQTSGYAVETTLSSDGVLNDFVGIATNRGFQIAAVGAATNRFFYTVGDPASLTGLPTFKPIDTPFEPRVISFVGGDGGHGSNDVGGLGGSVSGLTYTQTLGGGVLSAGGTYATFVTTGSGGASDNATGGAGGALTKVSLTLNAGYQNSDQDDTTSVFLSTGHGGSGTSGGAGGNVSKVTSKSVFGQVGAEGDIVGAVTMRIVSGDGGAGANDVGGAGGTITLDGPSSLSGVTYYDPSSINPEAQALQVKSGSGGDGVTAGGAGGTVTKVGAQNALFGGNALATNELRSALIESGHGGNASAGDGGAGGGITGLNVAVDSIPFSTTDPVTGKPVTILFDGSATVVTGNGGNGIGGLGGNAGALTKSTVAALSGDVQLGYGVLVKGGTGGAGDLGGGNGGGMKKLALNTASTNDAFAAVLVGGNGGASTGDGTGGAGGTIKAITQSKDVNSNINTIAAGNGGTSASGAGGVGGSVRNVSTEGFIGLPSITTGDTGIYLGVFDDAIHSPTVASLFATGSSVPQGIFAGRGGSGAANGLVNEIVARQIAAIAATVDGNGVFAPARSIGNVHADLIGYDEGLDGGFTSSQPGVNTPVGVRPVDGFLLANEYGTIAITSGDNTRTDKFQFQG